jgi:hypothetical protein
MRHRFSTYRPVLDAAIDTRCRDELAVIVGRQSFDIPSPIHRRRRLF